MSTVQLQLSEHPLPPVTGSVGIAQGAYGDRGNLELVAPDPDDGFWVFWFNGDAVEHRSGAARGHWDAGLHVPTGSRLMSARISQVSFGPHFLEVVGRVETGSLHRWYWTPGHGFVAGGIIASAAGAKPARLVGSADRLITMRVDDAGVEVLTSGVERYPELSWHSSHVPVDGIATSVDIDVAPGVAPDISPGSDDIGSDRDAVHTDDGQSMPGVGLVVVDARARLLRPIGSAGWQLGTALPGEWRTAQIHFVNRTAAVLTGLDIDGRPVVAAVTLDHAAGSKPGCPDASLSDSCVDLGGPVDDIAACLSTLPTNPAAAEPARTLEVVTRTGTELHHLRFDADTLRPHRTGANAVRARTWN